jgi:hypothetical protein
MGVDSIMTEPNPREKHCAFAVLNNYGKCVAYCTWNQKTGYLWDCIGNSGNDNDNDGREVQIKGIRP